MAWAGWLPAPAAAQQIEDEVVPGPGIYAFSGPGKHFYAAYALTPGEKITVHGIAVGEPGQEFVQIIPATDRRGFSWVRVADTETRKDGAIVAARDKAPVYVGSDLFRDRRYVRQVRLSQGDIIVPKGKVEDQEGAWYYIVPPEDEVRYVKKDELYKPAAKRGPETAAAPGGADRGVGNAAGRSAARAAAGEDGADGNGPNPDDLPPPARPVGRIANNEAERTRRSAQPVAARGNLAAQLDDLEADLVRLQETEPERWNLDALRARQNQAEEDLRERPNAAARQRAAETKTKLDLYAHFDEVLRRSRDAHRQYQRQDAQDAAELDRLRQRLAVPAAARPQAVGTLQAVRTPINGQPAYALADSSGRITHYVVGAKGLPLDRYLRRPVGLFGKVRNVRGSAVPVIDAEQISPNVRLDPTGR